MTSTHIFFCSLPDCGNATLRSGTTCMAHTGCPDCGDMGAVSLSSVYCHGCQMRRSHSCIVRVSDELKAELLANLSDNWSFTPASPCHTSLESMRAEIAEIEERLRTNMTKGQKDDWIWILQNRRADLADAEKEMWAGYDEDDLRKLDRQSRY